MKQKNFMFLFFQSIAALRLLVCIGPKTRTFRIRGGCFLPYELLMISLPVSAP